MVSIPIPSLGGLNSVLDSVEMLKRAWSNFNLPAQFTPAMSVEELDKKISELKTVEQWLTLNLNMLRGTIQGMELQRGAMDAVGAFGKAMQQTVTSQPEADASDGPSPRAAPAENAQATSATSAAESATVNPAAWWSLLQSQFNQIAQSALAAASPQVGERPKPTKSPTRKTGASRSAGKRDTAARAAGKKRPA